MAAGSIHALVWLPVVCRALFDPRHVSPNLFPIHTRFTLYAFDDWWRPATPGYLWDFTTNLANRLIPGTDPRVGAAVTATAFFAAYGVVVFELLRRRTDRSTLLGPSWALTASLLVVLAESPAALAGWEGFTDRGGLFLPVQLWFAPTSIAVLALNLVAIQEVCDFLGGLIPRRHWWRVGALLVLTTLAKPTLTPLLVVAVPLVHIASSRCRLAGPDRPRIADVVGFVVLPTALILAAQTWVTVNKVVYTGDQVDDRGGWHLNPGAELSHLGALRPLFWAVAILPLAAIAFGGARILRDRPVRLLVVASSLALAAAFLFERSRSEWKGDMLQLSVTAIGLLCFFSFRWWLERWSDAVRRDRTTRKRLTPFVSLSVIVAIYVVSGVLRWSCHTGLGCPVG
ncbi:MAG: hypothetical protein R2698_04215 [Microthrixaceae bacterium]